jgi:hypothetical protein
MSPHNGGIEQNMGRCNFFPSSFARGAACGGFDFA